MFSKGEFFVHSALALLILVADSIIGALLSPISFIRTSGYSVLEDNESIDLRGQITIITGSNTGIGQEAARQLAKYGATVILACRNVRAGMEASQRINDDLREAPPATYPYAQFGKTQFMRLDLSDLASVLDFAEKIKNEFTRVDILINNADINSSGQMPTGVQQLFHVNYLGHYLLVRCLTELLSTPAESNRNQYNNVARVINLSSVTHHTGQPDFEASAMSRYSDCMKKQGCSYYADSKLYMNYLTMEINRRYDISRPYDTRAGSTYATSERSDGEAGSACGLTAEEGACEAQSADSTSRPILSISVNPGAVRSDIWRNYPYQTLYQALMRVLFLEVAEGAATAVAGATMPLDDIRSYQSTADVSMATAEDVGGKLVRRADVPYLVPYAVRFGWLAGEIFGVFRPPSFAGVSLPTRQNSDGCCPSGSSARQHLNPTLEAQKLWQYSANLCIKILSTSAGSKAEDFSFLRS